MRIGWTAVCVKRSGGKTLYALGKGVSQCYNCGAWGHVARERPFVKRWERRQGKNDKWGGERKKTDGWMGEMLPERRCKGLGKMGG